MKTNILLNHNYEFKNIQYEIRRGGKTSILKNQIIWIEETRSFPASQLYILNMIQLQPVINKKFSEEMNTLRTLGFLVSLSL